MCFKYMSEAISWASKKQATVALSSCEAEIVAASEAAKEAISLRGLLDDLGFGDSRSPLVSMSTTSRRSRSRTTRSIIGRMKHTDRRHYFVRECVENLQIVNLFVASAEFFTKALCPKAFFPMRNRIMNHDPWRAAICGGSLPGLPAALPLDDLEASFDM